MGWSVALWSRRDLSAEGDDLISSEAQRLSAFVGEEAQGQVKALEFAEPALLLCASAPVKEVGLKFVEAWEHAWVDAQHRAAQAGVFVAHGVA